MVTPENKLWRAVLEQAFEDAELAEVAAIDFAPAWRVGARRYLRGDSRFEAADLKLVCDFADVPADRLVLWARKRYPFAA